ncbi:MAG: adenylyltransferase/cytidyltransferase family protein, partial [Acidobacteria bacterium]|nr:adenylyltransferase/cytidyltransferase family protein [Acidobacteriota bacterium]
MKRFRDFEEKILKREEIAAKLGKESRGSAKLVLANGCFDLLHINYLMDAKSFGDILLVAVNSDSSVKKLKGEKRPIIPEYERARIIAAIRYVDYVVVFEEENVCSIIREVKPDIHCKGGDYTEK